MILKVNQDELHSIYIAWGLKNERRVLDLARPSEACSIRRKNGAATSRDIQSWPRPIHDDDQFGSFTRAGFFGADCRESIDQLCFPSVSRACWKIRESCSTPISHMCGKDSGPIMDWSICSSNPTSGSRCCQYADGCNSNYSACCSTSCRSNTCESRCKGRRTCDILWLRANCRSLKSEDRFPRRGQNGQLASKRANWCCGNDDLDP